MTAVTNIKKLTGYPLMGILLVLSLVLAPGLRQAESSEGPQVSRESIDILQRIGRAMAEVSATVKPSVVNISTTKIVKQQQRGPSNRPFDDPFFRRFFGEEFYRQFKEPRERKSTSLGSGVIVDESGYILTNNHVIKDADEIKVTLLDKRVFVGKVKGVDPKTDLAVIKIEAEGLPAIKWGDSKALRTGDTVIAVGSPYGLGHTVTSGIVSAKGRANVGIADYEDFIQTDAAINPGNSGGALVDIRGQLVGINTAIFSTSGGYQGIGFAIPSAMARTVLDSLISEGKVVRGWLGVWIQPVTKVIAEQFQLESEKGALVSDVFEDSPAQKAGIKRGDIIIEYDGTPIEDSTALRNRVAASQPNTEVLVKVIREGEPVEITVALGELPDDKAMAQGFENAMKGVFVQDITPKLRESFNIPKRVTGVLITEVGQESPSSGKLRPGDVIMEVNRTKVRSTGDFRAEVSKIPEKQEILLLIFRDGRFFYHIVTP